VHPLPSSQAAPGGQAAAGVQELGPGHVTSHPHALVQSMPATHEPLPEQVTSHRPSPHSTAPRQAPALAHSITQDDAELQLTPPEHEPWP
jgi:hypothetical protein